MKKYSFQEYKKDSNFFTIMGIIGMVIGIFYFGVNLFFGANFYFISLMIIGFIMPIAAIYINKLYRKWYDNQKSKKYFKRKSVMFYYAK